MREWVMGTIIGDYIGTTIRDPFPHSLLSTRQSKTIEPTPGCKSHEDCVEGDC